MKNSCLIMMSAGILLFHASNGLGQQTVSVRDYDPRNTDWEQFQNRSRVESTHVRWRQEDQDPKPLIGPPPADEDAASPSDRFGPNSVSPSPVPEPNFTPNLSQPQPIDGAMQFSDLGNDLAPVHLGYGNQCNVQGGNACDEPWRLIQLNNSRMQIGGWISGGVTVADHNVASTNPVAFPNPTDEFLFNQVWLHAERALQTQSCGWDWGFRVDALFGADGPDTQAFGDRGWDFGWNSGGTGGNTYGTAIPQAYLQFGRGDLSFKVGRFFTTIGNESVPVVNNFFYSHTYAMNYGEPFTHTGALAEYQVHDHIKLLGGYTFGWDSGFENFLNAHTFLGGTEIDLTDYLSVAYMLNVGDFGDGTAKGLVAGNSGDILLQSLVTRLRMSDRLQSISQIDAGSNQGPGSGDNEWYGFNQTFVYQFNRCWGAGLRYEVFRDHAGTQGRVSNNAETYQAWTTGINWQPTRNLRIRPEVRWDYVDNGTRPFGGNGSLVTFGVDAILRF